MSRIAMKDWSYDYNHETNETTYTVEGVKVSSTEFCNELAEQQFREVDMLTRLRLKSVINTAVRLGVKVKTDEDAIKVISASLQEVYKD